MVCRINPTTREYGRPRSKAHSGRPFDHQQLGRTAASGAAEHHESGGGNGNRVRVSHDGIVH
jgi:hypothetical protein